MCRTQIRKKERENIVLVFSGPRRNSRRGVKIFCRNAGQTDENWGNGKTPVKKKGN